MSQLKISELFYSIQGEGVNQGIPTVFVRLFGCNLYPNTCKWCDTKYAQGDSGPSRPSSYPLPYEVLDVEEVIKRIVKLSPWVDTHVCITGGEPLFQPNVEELISELRKGNYYIEVFTNGTMTRPRWWTKADSWIVDIKCPSSSVPSCLIHWGWLDSRVCDQIKLTVENEEDLVFASGVIAKCVTRNPQVIVSPVLNTDRDLQRLQRVAEFCKEKRVRLSTQQHKIIWGNKKGV